MKIRVLVVGEVLLKGRPVKLTELGEALKQGAAARTAVSYYRELASGEPPALAIQVLKLITELRLPIRLSSQPDFSDTITTSERGLEDIFAQIRESAAQGQVVILRPGGRQNSGVNGMWRY